MNPNNNPQTPQTDENTSDVVQRAREAIKAARAAVKGDDTALPMRTALAIKTVFGTIPELIAEVERLHGLLPDHEDLWDAQQCVQDWRDSDSCDDTPAHRERPTRLAGRLRDAANAIAAQDSGGGV